MKKGLIVLGVAGLLAGSVALMAGGKNEGDEARARAVLADKTLEDLTAQAEGPTSLGPPDLTDPVINAVLEELKDPESAGGLLRIARRHGCSMQQVKDLARWRNERLTELQEAQAEPIEK